MRSFKVNWVDGLSGYGKASVSYQGNSENGNMPFQFYMGTVTIPAGTDHITITMPGTMVISLQQ